MNAKLSSRLKLIGVCFAYAGPLLIAAVLYFGQHWFEFETTAQGHLVTPGQTLNGADFRLIKTAQDHDINNLPLLDGRWLLLFNATVACDLYCQANLFKMRQARLVLGRDAARVRTVYLLSATDFNPELNPPELNDLLATYPALSVYQKDPRAQQQKQQLLLQQNQIYIADPKGNLVLRYAIDAYSRDIIKDFKRLLKASKIG